MFRRQLRRLGSFTVESRLTPDWNLFFLREDVHTACKAEVENYRESTEALETLDLSRANELVEVFTKFHNVDELSWVVKHIREMLGEELEPHHYDALIRVFNFERNVQGAAELVDVVFSRGRETQSTYARCIDCIHNARGMSGLTDVLRIIEAVEESGQSLVDGSGTESSSPVLSALLHHVATLDYHVVAWPVVVMWIRALGVELSDWDYAHVITTLVKKPVQYAAFLDIYGTIEGCKRGFASWPKFRTQLEKSLEFAHERGISNTDIIMELVEAAQRSVDRLDKAKRERQVPVGVMNRQIDSLDAHIRATTEFACRYKGLGPSRVNPASLYHFTMVLFMSMRQHTQGLRMLPAGLAAQREWRAKYGAEETPYLASLKETKTPRESAKDLERSEDFNFDIDILFDASSCLTHASQRVVGEVHGAFAGILNDVQERSPNEKQLKYLSASNLLMPPEEVDFEAALAQIIEECEGKAYVPSITKNAIRMLLEAIALQPPRNARLSEAGYAERVKWRNYLEAREMALMMFGSGQMARDMMKKFYYKEPGAGDLRSQDEVASDAELLDGVFPSVGSEADHVAEGDLLRHIRNPIRSPPDLVPKHLNPTSVDENPYPHALLKRAAITRPRYQPVRPNAVKLSAQHQASSEPSLEPVFDRLWAFLQEHPDRFYFQHENVYLLIAKCLLHRLRWEELAKLTMDMSKHQEFSYHQDHMLAAAFAEIGDPAGLLPYKIATKLFEGRISDKAKQAVED